MTSGWKLLPVVLLTGCPTMKEVSWTIVPDEHLATLRMHDVRSDDGSEDDWMTAAALASVMDGARLVGGLVRYEEVDGGLDVIATFDLEDSALAAMLPRTNNVGMWCGPEAILRTNGHDLTSVLGTPCVAWEAGQEVFEVSVGGDATDDQPSVLEDWRATGAPASLQEGDERLLDP